MAEFTPKKIVLGDINNGIEFTESDGVTPNAINDPIEAVAYSQTVVEHLTDTPDTSEINGAGSPNVSFVSNTTADGVTIYKFKFSNLSGATFTPSLDEAGNLSWSNNRNLPNPPTINISGRDYLFSSEVLSGNYIPQVNSEVTDMPLTSFNRAPVDDIDHCYLFYYYTLENIYYWLATQVVDIQETTATLKILSVVRLTGYTPTIGENGNWVINGEDTGKPSYGASGVTDVVAGASYNQDDFTITPLTFNFEVGNSKTVNVKAAVGNVEDGSYAKLAQVVRVDSVQSLTDEQKTQAQNNMGLDDKYAQLSQVVRTDSAQSLSEAQKQQGQANLGLDEKYAKQDGTYPNLSAGKATADGSGNDIEATYAKSSQVVRIDTSQSLTDTQKQQAQDNINVVSGKGNAQNQSVGWYQVAELRKNGTFEIVISQAYNYVSPEEIHLSVNVGYTSDKNVTITQLSGYINNEYTPTKVRVRANADYVYFDIYSPSKSFNLTRVTIKGYLSTNERVVTTDGFTYIGTSDTAEGYNIVSLDLKTGVNTSGAIYSNGSPVLVGSAPTWIESISGSHKLPSAGWYIFGYKNHYTGIQYWDGSTTTRYPLAPFNSAYIYMEVTGNSGALMCSEGNQGTVQYYKLA